MLRVTSSFRLILPLVMALALTACGDKPADEPTGENPSTGGGTQDGVDQGTPKALAESIFRAAASGNFAGLENIADPKDADGDSKRVAGVASAEEKDQEEFRTYFKLGKVVGEPRIDGDKAEVDITFGPEGKKKETFKMRRHDGRWYLQSF